MVPGRRIYFRKARASTGKQHPAPAQSSDFCNLGNDTAKTNSRPIPPGMLPGLIPFVTDMDRPVQPAITGCFATSASMI